MGGDGAPRRGDDPRTHLPAGAAGVADHRRELEAIVRTTPSLLRALVAAREVDAPDWLIGAGAVRNAVWDRLHGFTEPTPPGDVDLAFFDPADLSRERGREVESALRERAPDLPWEATNQAAVHLWYGEDAEPLGSSAEVVEPPGSSAEAVEPLGSSAEAVATWPETATCVALRLDASDRLEIVAPFGLDDLFAMIWRRNPARVTVADSERRLASKRIAERWPLVTVIAA